MRTNIVLDDQLVNEAMKLSGQKTKKDVVNLALHQLVQSLRKESQKHSDFITTYIDHPIKLEAFTPLNRDDLYER
ncbi:MAG TPA: type II toxin-antitoxin system VapB family antitoxin [Gammaproteobacteria bacterium]|nr:type II toxin-antitoxin system VapB family antitoxin [Gammaproteobacteria bacterium]